jgi:hypothetical protein
MANSFGSAAGTALKHGLRFDRQADQEIFKPFLKMGVGNATG